MQFIEIIKHLRQEQIFKIFKLPKTTTISIRLTKINDFQHNYSNSYPWTYLQLNLL